MPSEVTTKHVNRALRDTVWPAVKEHGFTRRTPRTAWRDRPDQVDVITFWSHNAYNAGALGVTTSSFQIQLGVHPCFRTSESTPVKDGQLRPQEYACDFRRLLLKNFRQEETDRSEIWYVRADGANLTEIVEAARDMLLTEGLAWFNSLQGLERMLATARNEPEDMDKTWGMGNLGSPHRRELVAGLEAMTARGAN
jgi:hypothetical protein